LALGIVFGLLVLIAMLGLYYAKLKGSSALRDADVKLFEKLQQMKLDSPEKFIALGVFLSVLHAFLEEYYWRWFVFGQLRRGLPLGLAIVLSSLAFAAHHVIVLWTYMPNWTATIVFSLGVALGGAAWAWIYHRSRSLIGSWLSHVLVDAGLMWIGFDLCRRFWE
jgi:membrane protease YdiL (CAAX protease family)